MKRLNLGCGINQKEGYVNCDISEEVNPDMIVDLEKPLPFEDNSIDRIMSNHILEHIENFNELINEIHRVCKEGSIVEIRVPFYTHYGAFTDPTHKRFFTPFTFDYFADSPFRYESAKSPLFKINKVKLKFVYRNCFINRIINPIVNWNHRVYCRFFANIFPVAEIHFELVVIKGLQEELEK